MHDALQELSELLLELQKWMVPSNSAHKAIFREIRVFEAMLEQPGHYTKFRRTEEGKPKNTYPQVFFSNACKELERPYAVSKRVVA